jgi:hypothetical protein
MLKAVKYDIDMQQGSRFFITITWLGVDGNPHPLIGYNAEMQIRNYVDAADIIDTYSDPVDITLDDSGNISIDISAVRTAGYDFNKAKYDLELWPTGSEEQTTRLVEGTITLKKEVTR